MSLIGGFLETFANYLFAGRRHSSVFGAIMDTGIKTLLLGKLQKGARVKNPLITRVQWYAHGTKGHLVHFQYRNFELEVRERERQEDKISTGIEAQRPFYLVFSPHLE